jgi:hypothetical protein
MIAVVIVVVVVMFFLLGHVGIKRAESGCCNLNP